MVPYSFRFQDPDPDLPLLSGSGSRTIDVNEWVGAVLLQNLQLFYLTF